MQKVQTVQQGFGEVPFNNCQSVLTFWGLSYMQRIEKWKTDIRLITTMVIEMNHYLGALGAKKFPFWHLRCWCSCPRCNTWSFSNISSKPRSVPWFYSIIACARSERFGFNLLIFLFQLYWFFRTCFDNTTYRLTDNSRFSVNVKVICSSSVIRMQCVNLLQSKQMHIM